VADVVLNEPMPCDDTALALVGEVTRPDREVARSFHIHTPL